MLGLALALLLPQAPSATREERVLELVRGLQREGSWHYSRAFFETVPPPIGKRPIVVPSVWLFCGNSDEGSV